MKLEVVVTPVSDVDRAKKFYSTLGWRLDADRAAGDNFRLVQFTPPGSGSSIQFGVNLTPAAPGSAQAMLLAVSDIEAARSELIAHASTRARCFTVRPEVPRSSLLCEAFLVLRIRVSSCPRLGLRRPSRDTWC